VGWGSIIYLAALTGIDPNLYEAAVVEGARRAQRIRFITLPGIMPTIVILFILNVRTVVTVGFEKVYLMYNPAIYETADVFATYLYRRGILEADYSYATAVGFFNSVVALVLIVLCNRIARALGDVSLW
jgi:putative aldouronate transport system permease protein